MENDPYMKNLRYVETFEKEAKRDFMFIEAEKAQSYDDYLREDEERIRIDMLEKYDGRPYGK